MRELFRRGVPPCSAAPALSVNHALLRRLRQSDWHGHHGWLSSMPGVLLTCSSLQLLCCQRRWLQAAVSQCGGHRQLPPGSGSAIAARGYCRRLGAWIGVQER